jgi:hypothetical protein
MTVVTRYAKIGDYPVLDPRLIAQGIAGQEVPVSVWRRANAIHCGVGAEPGRAWFLLTREAVQSLSGSEYHDITWYHENDKRDAATSTTFQQYVIVDTQMVGVDGDGQAAFLVEMADKRRILQMSALDQNYNLHNPAPQESGGTDDYYSDSLNAGALWTWQTAIENAWGELPGVAGSCPTLPYTPDSQPEDLRYLGYSAWDAVNEMLQTIGCTVAYDPMEDAFSFVRFGATQEGLVSAFTTLTDRLMYHHADEQDYALAQAPENVRVYFPRRDQYMGVEDDTVASSNWEIQPYHSIDVATNVSGAQAGTIQRVWDAMPALYVEGSLDNGSALSTRADEIKETLVKSLDQSFDILRKHYSGIVTTISPGSQVCRMVWRDYSDGCVTEVHKTRVQDMIVGVDRGVHTGSENFQRPDLARRSHPVWPHVAQLVQIWDSGSSQGDEVSANASGLFPGRVRSYRDGTLRTLDDCWVRIADLTDADGLDGDHAARNGDCFVGRLFGLAVHSDDERPVYFVRKGGGGNTLIGGCLDEDHPGRGIAFDIQLGTWDPANDKWTYGGTAKAIDWRYDVPYPDAGATGLFEARASDTHGTIYECVALDCDTPGSCGS